jgi:hypothetical protein
MVVVTDPILEPSRRSGGLYASDQALGDQHTEGIVDRLQRDGTDLGPDHFGHGISRDVRLTGYGPQDRQSLGRHLDTALPKEVSRGSGHCARIAEPFESFKYLTDPPRGFGQLDRVTAP